MIFRSPYINRPSTVATPTGKPVEPTFGFFIDKDTGEEKFGVTGCDNVYARTQEARPADIYTLLENTGVQASAIDAFKVAQSDLEGLIDDFSKVPHSLMEAHALVHDISDRFDLFDPTIKALFNNNKAEFFQSVHDGSVEKRMSDYIAKISKNVPDPDPTEGGDK